MLFAHLADVHIGAWRDPRMKELPIQAFERAVDRDYYRALEQRIPILQDVHAFVPENKAQGRRESYRRLITPNFEPDGTEGVLVASCVLRDIPVPGKTAE